MHDKLFREYKEKQQGLLFKMKQLDSAIKSTILQQVQYFP